MGVNSVFKLRSHPPASHRQAVRYSRFALTARDLGPGPAGQSVLLLWPALLLVLYLLAACSARKPSAEGTRPVVDELGRTVMVVPQPGRIVSLAPSITETLFALGLGDRVIGVTSYCDYPPEATRKEKVGDTLRPSVEKIVTLKPDLVIISTASQLEQFLGKLEELGIPIYVSNPRDLEGVFKSISNIGLLTGVSDRATELINSLRARVESVQSRLARSERPRVLFVLGTEPLITVGGKSFINDLITRAGGASISADEGSDYPQYSLETAVARQPEIIFLQSGESELAGRLKGTPAGVSGRVFHLDDALLLRPGPRTVDGLEQMAARIHPEVFKDKSG